MIDNINNVNIAIWFFPKGLYQKEIYSRDKKFAKHLSERKYKEYAYTRGYARYVLANLFKLNPSDVPIYSVPGNQPYLEKGWGYLSLSHCDDAILITWSKKKIGIDIERTDRKIPFRKICNRFFTPNEKKIFNHIKGNNQKNFKSKKILKSLRLSSNKIYEIYNFKKINKILDRTTDLSGNNRGSFTDNMTVCMISSLSSLLQ